MGKSARGETVAAKKHGVKQDGRLGVCRSGRANYQQALNENGRQTTSGDAEQCWRLTAATAKPRAVLGMAWALQTAGWGGGQAVRRALRERGASGGGNARLSGGRRTAGGPRLCIHAA